MDSQYSELASRLRQTVRKDPLGWAAISGIQLRPYQSLIALAVKDSIIHKKGLTFVVILPRQSGKNEVQRHIFGWLLCRAAEIGGTIVSVAPTFKPQTINAMERMRLTLDANIATRGQWHSSAGFIFRFEKARLQFFSGEHTSKVVGATADLLLSVDEAQDIEPGKFDKDFDPMTASTNATRVFWGTAWTSRTLLARQIRVAREEEKQDGIQRVFFYTGDDVAKIVPEYAAHLERVVKEKGRQHPLVKTQYFNEEIDAQAGMFNAGRLAMIQSSQQSAVGSQPSTGCTYAFLIDVAGMDEANVGGVDAGLGGYKARPYNDGIGNPGRDSTTLTVVEIDLSTLETLQAPTYRVVHREAWQGLNHLTVFGKLKALTETWRPQHMVIDATGVGEGLWAMLDRAFPTRVIPVKFTQQEKSEIGWKFLSIIETGRFRDCAPSDTVRMQYAMCQSEILPGPAKTLRWGVPDGTRGPDGQLVHDDHVVADSLVAKLDELEWSFHSPTLIVWAKDPLEEMSRFR
jgi:terminase large subunit-like protein